MKIKQILTAAAVITVLSGASAMAQTPAAPATPATAAPAATSADASSKTVKKFDEYKEKTIKRLEKRADEIQKKQACVTAATNPKELHACFPKWQGHHEKQKDKK